MKLVFIGCVQFSFTTLSRLLPFNNSKLEIVGVITKESSAFNADFASLVPLAIENNIPYYIAKRNDQQGMLNWLKKLSPDIIYCFGWAYLLNESILRLPKIGVVGYHPAALPQNRGRHPIIWALALGLQKTASTFFFMDQGADSGDILSQRFLPILSSDDASTLYHKLTETACNQITEFTPKLISGNFKRMVQDHSKANYWRKRNKVDGEIDWRMSAICIHNLVRALTHPYAGAHFVYDRKDVKVWKTLLVENSNREYENIEGGKIVEIDGPEILVKCGWGLLKLIEYDCNLSFKVGWYL